MVVVHHGCQTELEAMHVTAPFQPLQASGIIFHNQVWHDRSAECIKFLLAFLPLLRLSLPLFAPQPGQRHFPWADRGAPGWQGDWCSGDSGDSASPAVALTRLHHFISNDVFISLISFLWSPAILILVISRQGQRCKCQSCWRRITCVCWRLIAGILGAGGQAALIIGAYRQNYVTTLQALWLARQQKDLEGERAGWCMLLDGWAGQQPVQLHTTPSPLAFPLIPVCRRNALWEKECSPLIALVECCYLIDTN